MKRVHFSSLTFYTFTRGEKGEYLLKLLSHCKDMLQFILKVLFENIKSKAYK